MDEVTGLKMAIEEMRRSLDKQTASIHRQKDLTKTLFTGASLFTGLVASLQILSSAVQPGYEKLLYGGVVLATISYLVMVVLVLHALKPFTIHGPVKDDWNVLWEVFCTGCESSVHQRLLVAYLNAMELNDPANRRLTILNMWLLRLLGWIVFVLVLLSFIPRA
jgi:hypothetical protein